MVDYDLIYGINCFALPMNGWTLCMKCFLYVNSVSGLCLHLRDIALNINLPFDMCRWLVEGEDVEGVHKVLAKHHLSHLDSRSDTKGESEPGLGRETIYWDSLPVFFPDIGGPKSYN